MLNRETLKTITIKQYFLEEISSKLGTILTVPEETVIEQGDEGMGIFFIQAGDCIVSVNSYFRKNSESRTIKMLVESDHFGEISTIYGCPTTANIISRNYDIMAYLSTQLYKDLTSDSREYELHLKQYIFNKYNDPLKKMVYRMIQKVEYLKRISEDMFHQILY